MPTRRLARSNDADERRRRACVPAPRRRRRTATSAREATTVRLPKPPRSHLDAVRTRRSGKRFPPAATTDPTTASGVRRRHRRPAASIRRLAKNRLFSALPRCAHRSRATRPAASTSTARGAPRRSRPRRCDSARAAAKAGDARFAASERRALHVESTRRARTSCRREAPSSVGFATTRAGSGEPATHATASAASRCRPPPERVGRPPIRRRLSAASSLHIDRSSAAFAGRRGEAGIERARRRRTAQNENGERRAGCRDRGPVLRSPLPPPSGRRCRIGWDQWSSSSSSSA